MKAQSSTENRTKLGIFGIVRGADTLALLDGVIAAPFLTFDSIGDSCDNFLGVKQGVALDNGRHTPGSSLSGALYLCAM